MHTASEFAAQMSSNFLVSASHSRQVHTGMLPRLPEAKKQTQGTINYAQNYIRRLTQQKLSASLQMPVHDIPRTAGLE